MEKEKMEIKQENKEEKQISETEWCLGTGKCKVRIETTGEIDKTDILVQTEYTVQGLGYGINVESNLEE